MSAKKNMETKILEDETTDSGFISGTVSEEPFPSEDLDTMDDKPVDSDKMVISSSECTDPESGVVLSESLSRVDISDQIASEQGPLIVIDDHKTDTSPLPPLDLLFQQDVDGDTQLHIAAVHGCQKSVGTLIRVCPDKAWLDVPNDYGHTALHLAAMSGHAVVTRMLVKAGASLAIRDRTGETPLHKAVAVRSLECIQALLAQVPEHSARKHHISTILDQKNYKGQGGVHLAATAGHVDTLQMLVYFGADINATENLAGWTPLHIAARRGDVKLVQYLLTKCSDVDDDARDYAGRSARKFAKSNRTITLFKELDSDSDDDSDDETCPCAESDAESFFESLVQAGVAQSGNLINVV